MLLIDNKGCTSWSAHHPQLYTVLRIRRVYGRLFIGHSQYHLLLCAGAGGAIAAARTEDAIRKQTTSATEIHPSVV